MKSTKILTILFMAFGLMVWPVSTTLGALSLTVNGEPLNEITMRTGQTFTVEIVSDNNDIYSANIGFDNGLVLGEFSHIETMPAADPGSFVGEVNEPDFYGYRVAAGVPPVLLPSAGVHFIFEYSAQQIGVTYLKLYDSSRTSLLDFVKITIVSGDIGTAFTYQGGFNDTGVPADGLYDFQFSLYNDANTFIGNQIGDTININDLDVIAGYFTVELDFGLDVFTGYARWLQITIRPADSNDVNDFVTLSPRQELTPIPYAIYAENTRNDNDWMVSGDNIHSIPSGNVGIGTTSPEGKLEVSHDGTAHDLVVDPLTGNIGIGKTSPAAKLDIRGSDPLLAIDTTNVFAGIRLKKNDANGWTMGWAGKYLYFYEHGATTRMMIRDGTGNVGIATNTPNEKLTVNGALSLDMISPPSASAGYGKVFVKSTDGELYFINDAGTEYKLSAGSEDFIVGDFLISSNDTERVTPAPAATLLKMTKIGRGGSLRIKFDLHGSHPSYPVYGAVYRNNVVAAPIRMTFSTSYVTFTEDISGWLKGDLVQVYVFTSNPTYPARVRNLRLYADNPTEAGAHSAY